MTEQSQDSNEEIAYGETGLRLKAAREKAGLDLQTLADQLHLRPVIVRAIEEGHYESVPSELFLKGYVRSYARHVGISDDEMIRLLSRELASQKDTEEEDSLPGHLPAEESQQRRQKMGLLGVALVVVVLLLLPFIWPGSEEPEPGVEAPETMPSDEMTGSDVEPALRDVEPLAPAPGTRQESPQDPQEEPPQVTETAPVQSPRAEPEAGPRPEAEPVRPREPAAQLAGSDEAHIQLRFNGDCWVEVVNGDGRTVVARLATAGDEIRYQGPGPLNVLLGAVNAVEQAEFMGQTLDLSQYPARAGRARFELAVNDFVSDQD